MRGVSTVADDRLKKLVLMLSSDQPGEVAAAAKAIDRALEVQGRDWNWLAAKLGENEAPEVRSEAAAEPRARRDPPPPSEPPCYAEPKPRARPWGKPPRQPPSAGPRWFVFQWGMWLSGFCGRGKQIVAVLGTFVAFIVFASVCAPLALGLAYLPALILIGLLLWGCVWLVLNAIAFWRREIKAVIRWCSRSRA
jgi:hypothetical protein